MSERIESIADYKLRAGAPTFGHTRDVVERLMTMAINHALEQRHVAVRDVDAVVAQVERIVNAFLLETASS